MCVVKALVVNVLVEALEIGPFLRTGESGIFFHLPNGLSLVSELAKQFFVRVDGVPGIRDDGQADIRLFQPAARDDIASNTNRLSIRTASTISVSVEDGESEKMAAAVWTGDDFFFFFFYKTIDSSKHAEEAGENKSLNVAPRTYRIRRDPTS